MPLGCHCLWEFTDTADSALKSSLCRGLCSTWSAREVKLGSASLAVHCVLALTFPSSGDVPAWCAARGGDGSRREWTKMRARDWYVWI